MPGIFDKLIPSNFPQFKAYFTDWKQSWHFARPDDTNKLLEEIGYVNTKVSSNSDFVIFPDRHMYSKFVKTVVMKTYLERLSPKLKTVFLELFLDEVKKHSNKSKKHWFLDFVRLNIVANRPYP